MTGAQEPLKKDGKETEIQNTALMIVAWLQITKVLLMAVFFLSAGCVLPPFSVLAGKLDEATFYFIAGLGCGLPFLWCTKNGRDIRKSIPRYSRRELVETADGEQQ